MEEWTLYLYLTDEAYGRRLLRFLIAKRHPALHPELITTREALRGQIEGKEGPVAILTDDEDLYEDEEQSVILLGDRQSREEKRIFQYQYAEAVYSELVALLHLDKAGCIIGDDLDKARGILMIYATEGTGQTVTAAMVAQHYGKQGSCLYICLSAFPVFYSGELLDEPDYHGRGLEELLMYADDKPFSDTLNEVVQDFGHADMLAPLRHYKDMIDCDAKEWQELFLRLRTEGGYDMVVVEVGQVVESLMDLLEQGDYIWLLQSEGRLGKIRDDVFIHYCQMERRDALLEKIETKRLPEHWKEWEEQLTCEPLDQWGANPQMLKEAELLPRFGEEVEDVCIWEDDG